MSATSQFKPWDSRSRTSSALALTLAGIAALLASACCVFPLLLVLLGISGVWISQLRWLEPYSTALMVLSVGSLSLAGWRLFRAAPDSVRTCDSDDRACLQANAQARRWFWLVSLIALIPILVPLAAPWFY
jgi:mercuric ion transport protein